MGSDVRRKEIIKEFKERKVPRGVFAVRCTATGRAWVDSSMNLEASRNRAWFSLRLGSHDNKRLQAEWNARGEEEFEYVVLETLKDDVPALELRDVLKDKKKHWAEQPGAETLFPEVPRK